MTANRHVISSCGLENILDLMMGAIAQLCEYMKKHSIVYFLSIFYWYITIEHINCILQNGEFLDVNDIAV